MVASRASCAVALFCAVACTFPEYRTPTGRTDSTCADAVLSGDETGVDCGGSCGACPSCNDGQTNGNESDLDCGGICSVRCSTNQRCREGTDCVSLVCADKTCQPPTCKDLVRNGHETGVDCGGDCQGCDNGSACTANDDCKSSRCQGEVCVDAGCTDQITNGKETDVDCGGPDCAPCPAAAQCVAHSDCESQLCSDDLCSMASCGDLVRNQGESDVDCGGQSCGPCPIDKACSQPSDCESTLCQSGLCVPQNASGQPLRRSSWQLSSSEGATEMGLSAPFDGDLATCWTSGSAQDAKMQVTIDLGEPRFFFKALVQTTVPPYDQDFPIALDVLVSVTGEFGDPALTNVMGNAWTWVDFPSAQVARYLRLELTKPSTRPWSVCEVNLYN